MAMPGSTWTPGERAALDELGRLGTRNVLVLHENVPRFDASGADLRILQTMEVLAAAGHDVTFVGRGGGDEPHHRERLAAAGVTVHAPDPERVFWADLDAEHLDLEGLVRRERFDVSLIYHWYWAGVSLTEQYEPLLRAWSPQTRVVVIMDDVHWLRETRRAEREADRSALERARGLRVKERETYRRADMLLAISDDDIDRMRAHEPGLEVLPLSFCREAIPDKVPGFAGRAGLLFLGTGLNDANRKAVEWFGDEVWPRVRARLPDATLHLVGEPPHASSGGWGIEDEPGVHVVGRADDLEPWLAGARVFVSPITYGTGLKTKNVQALGTGLPTVLTTISAEGMHLAGDSAAIVRDDPAAFADAVVALHEDEDAWTRTSHAALDHARARFGRERLVRDLTAFFEHLDGLAPGDAQAEPDACQRLFGVLPELAGARSLSARVRGHVDFARVLGDEGFTDEAIEELRFAFCELCNTRFDHPAIAELHFLLARLYLRAGEPGEAAEAALASLALDPTAPPERRAVLERLVALARVKEQQDAA
jgi:glycosyltransferase involved in cell wall biosynthesis